MELNKENMRKIRELILFTALLIVVLWKYEDVLAVLGFVGHLIFPFLLGGAIAFVLNVPMNFIERHLFPDKARKNKAADKLARPVSLLIVLSLVLGVLALIIFGVVPQLVNTFGNLGQSITRFVPQAQAWAKEVFHGNREVVDLINSIQFDWDKVMETLVDFLKNGAKNIINGVSTFVIAFVFAIYILLQKKKLGIQAKKVLFAFVRRGRAEAGLEVCSLTYNTFSSFLTGQCLEAVILGSMFVVAMTIFRLPYALLVGIFIAFTALIPIFGAFLGCAVGAFLIFMVDPMKAVMFVVLFLVLQQIEGNLIYPHVVGNSVGLPSIWVLAAVSIGGSLMGVVGMLIFIPIVSVAYALFREVVYLKLKKQGVDPAELEE